MEGFENHTPEKSFFKPSAEGERSHVGIQLHKYRVRKKREKGKAEGTTSYEQAGVGIFFLLPPSFFTLLPKLNTASNITVLKYSLKTYIRQTR